MASASTAGPGLEPGEMASHLPIVRADAGDDAWVVEPPDNDHRSTPAVFRGPGAIGAAVTYALDHYPGVRFMAARRGTGLGRRRVSG